MATAPGFLPQANEVGAALQSAVGSLVASPEEPHKAEASGRSKAQPADFIDAFGVDATLAWKLARIAGSADPLNVFLYMPGLSAMRSLLVRAESNRVPAVATAAARVALDRYAELVRRHGGSRRAFDLLVANHLAATGGEADSRLEIELRRAGYESAAFTLGHKARAQIALLVLSRSTDGSAIDLAVVRGFYGLQRLRPAPLWRLSQTVRVSPDFEPETRAGMRPIEGDAAEGLPIIGEFSDFGAGSFERRIASEDLVEFTLGTGEVGDTSAGDLIIGEVFDAARPASAQAAGNRVFRYLGGTKSPSERLICDTLVDASLFTDPVPDVVPYSSVFARSTVALTEGDRVPLRVTAKPIDPDVNGLELNAFPRHGALVRHTLARLGIDPAGMHASRCEVAYPPVPLSLDFHWQRREA